MKEITTIDNKTLVKILNNRKSDTDTLWGKIETIYKSNKSVWNNNPSWLQKIPNKKSKVRDDRVFLATESQINKIMSRPIKPVVLPANETDEAKEIADGIQDVFLDSYDKRDVKKHFKRGLRFLHFSRMMCLKVFWNSEIDDKDVKVMDPRKVRFSENSTCEEESEFAIETIDDKRILDLIKMFPNKKDIILKKAGLTEINVLEKNPIAEYEEMWIFDGVCWIYKGEVLDKQKNPFYDFDGLLVSPEEMADINETKEISTGERIPVRNGKQRRDMFYQIKREQKDRQGNPEKYKVYLYNHFDKPRKPYIFGTVLEVEDQPIGETSLIEIVTPLQEEVDKRKRQISDNSDMVNGITKVDTDMVTMSRADARAMHYDPEGLVYGPGVSRGVERETGQSLPAMVFEDMKDSRGEIDEIFGTTGTFRGAGDNEKTATGRAILREEGYSRLSEVIDLVDYMGKELYEWWYQLCKINYTESRMTKIIGADKAVRTIELMQDDLQDGIEIKIIPGQTLPEDKMFKSEKATEDMQGGIIDPVTYLRQTGGYDNPEEVVKNAMLFKINPFSILKMTDKDVADVIEAQKILSQMQPQAGEGEQGGGDPQQIAQMRKRIEQLVNSSEFKKLPPEEQKTAIQRIKEEFNKVGGAMKEQVNYEKNRLY